jgi:hypothetical protein
MLHTSRLDDFWTSAVESDRIVNKPAPKRKKELSYCPVSGNAMPAGTEVLVKISMLVTYMQGMARMNPPPPELVKFTREAEDLNEQSKHDDMLVDNNNNNNNNNNSRQYAHNFGGKQNPAYRSGDTDHARSNNSNSLSRIQPGSNRANSGQNPNINPNAHVDNFVMLLLTKDGKKRTAATVDKEVVDIIKRVIFCRENAIPANQKQRLLDVFNHPRIRNHAVAVCEDVALQASHVATEETQRDGRRLIDRNYDLSIAADKQETRKPSEIINNHTHRDSASGQITADNDNTHARNTQSALRSTALHMRRPSSLSACRVVEVRNIAVLENLEKSAGIKPIIPAKNPGVRNRAHSAPTYLGSSRGHVLLEEDAHVSGSSSVSRIMAFRRMKFAAVARQTEKNTLGNAERAEEFFANVGVAQARGSNTNGVYNGSHNGVPDWGPPIQSDTFMGTRSGSAGVVANFNKLPARRTRPETAAVVSQGDGRRDGRRDGDQAVSSFGGGVMRRASARKFSGDVRGRHGAVGHAKEITEVSWRGLVYVIDEFVACVE